MCLCFPYTVRAVFQDVVDLVEFLLLQIHVDLKYQFFFLQGFVYFHPYCYKYNKKTS